MARAMNAITVAILAGGLGSRLAEETRVKSKAMVRIGDEPILRHIIRYYASFGVRHCVVALGHQGQSIIDYFAESDLVEVAIGVQDQATGPGPRRWRDDHMTVDLVDTGLETQNGGRIKRLAPYLKRGTFMLTWCDGLADIDLHRLLAFHIAHGRLATLSAVHPPARFGRLRLNNDRVEAFAEKSIDPEEWINGAFFVLEPAVMDYIDNDRTHWERQCLTRLAAEGQLKAFRHESFWRCMDTLKEAQDLNALWQSGDAPWQVWTRGHVDAVPSPGILTEEPAPCGAKRRSDGRRQEFEPGGHAAGKTVSPRKNMT